MADLLDHPAHSINDQDDLFEMANLPESDTGIEGIVFISTAMAAHGPRVKWYPDRPRRDAPCLVVTIAESPELRNFGVAPPVARIAGPLVARWVVLNREALLRFWHEGTAWTRQEVAAHLDGLRKLV